MIKRTALAGLALIAAIVVMFAVQIVTTNAWFLTGISWGPDNLPVTAMQEMAALTTSFAAIFGGAIAGFSVSRIDGWKVLAIFGLIGVAFDGYIMLFKITEVSTWFRLSFVAVVPIATVVGGMLVARVFEWRKRPESSGQS
jgi:hypothetical protein